MDDTVVLDGEFNEVRTALMELVGVGENNTGTGLLDVPTQERGVQLLDKFEQEVFEGARQAHKGMARMGYAIFSIRQNSLWQYATNEDGNPKFVRFEDYLRDLADRGRIARSTAFQQLASLRIAVDGLGLTLDQVEDLGGSRTFNLLKRYVSYDRDTGEVYGLKDESVEIPEGKTLKEYLIDVVKSVSPASPDGTHELDLRPADIKAALHKSLSKEPEIVFFLLPSGKKGFFLGFAYSDDGVSAYSRKPLHEGPVPQVVLDRLQERLHIIQ